jgi:hypothetical protein
MRKMIRTILVIMFVLLLAITGTTAFASSRHIHDENCLHELSEIRDFTEFDALLENYILERIPVEIDLDHAPLITTSFPGGLFEEQKPMLALQLNDYTIKYQLGDKVVVMSKALLVIDDGFFTERGIECCSRMHVLEWTSRTHHPTPGGCSVTVMTIRQCQNCGSIWSRTIEVIRLRKIPYKY